MRVYIILLFLVLLTGCKAGNSTITNTKKHSLEETSISLTDSISIIEKILRNFEYNFDYSFIEYSQPDSTGRQYKVSETKIKGTGKQKEESTTESIMQPVLNIETSKEEKENTTEKVKHSYPWYIKLLMYLGAVFALIVFYKVVKTFRS